MHTEGGMYTNQPPCASTLHQMSPFFYGNAHTHKKKSPPSSFGIHTPLFCLSSQGREVYIMVISLICAPAATGNELITNKNAPGTQKKTCRMPPRVPKQDAAKQLESLFCPDLLFCFAPIGPPTWSGAGDRDACYPATLITPSPSPPRS